MGADGYRLSLRQHAGAQHRDTQQVEMIRLVVGCLSGGRHAADIGDDGSYIFIAQFSGIGVGHDDQPAVVRVDAIANGPKDVGISLATQSTGRCQVGGYERTDWHRKVLADVEASGERTGL